MATSIPSKKFVDKRTVLANDLAKNRSVSIALQNKFIPTRDALWKDHQQALYPNLMEVRNIPSVQNLLANELESTNQSDSLQLEALGRTNLMTITDAKTTDYIIDRLSDENLNDMNQNFPDILDTIKTKYSKMDKDRFIEIVKNYKDTLPEMELSERGRARQDKLEEVEQGSTRQSEIKARREEKRLERGSGEKGVADPFENIYEQYRDKVVTPQKNPANNPMSVSPKQAKKQDSVYFEWAKGDLVVNTAKERKAFQEASLEVAQLGNEAKRREYIYNLRPDVNLPKYNKVELTRIAVRAKYEDIIKKTGSGVRMITGRGVANESDKTDGKKMYFDNGKFVVNIEKLRKNILCVCYVSSRASIPSLKRESISSDTRDVLLDILYDRYSAKLFNKLQPDEQRLISTFVRVMKIPINMDEFDEAYNKNYQVLLGQVNSGQNNPEVKAELRLYILRGISESLIPKSQGQLMLYNLSL